MIPLTKEDVRTFIRAHIRSGPMSMEVLREKSLLVFERPISEMYIRNVGLFDGTNLVMSDGVIRVK